MEIIMSGNSTKMESPPERNLFWDCRFHWKGHLYSYQTKWTQSVITSKRDVYMSSTANWNKSEVQKKFRTQYLESAVLRSHCTRIPLSYLPKHMKTIRIVLYGVKWAHNYTDHIVINITSLTNDFWLFIFWAIDSFPLFYLSICLMTTSKW